MPFAQGQITNPLGGLAHKTPARKALNKTQKAFNAAIDLLGKKNLDNCGVTRLAELISVELEKDVVGTLHKLSSLLPKDVNVDVQHSANPLALSDEQLMQIIESRQKVKELDDSVVEVVESDTPK